MYRKTHFQVTVFSLSFAATLLIVPMASYTTEQAGQRREAREVKQETHQEARETKVECRQDKRNTKQDARKEGRDIKY